MPRSTRPGWWTSSSPTSGALGSKELARTRKTLESLQEALDHLRKGHKFLTNGDVFTDDLIETWISYKEDNELEPLRHRPTPYEFHLDYDSFFAGRNYLPR